MENTLMKVQQLSVLELENIYGGDSTAKNLGRNIRAFLNNLSDLCQDSDFFIMMTRGM